MTKRLIALLLWLALMPSGAHACSIVIQITLDFPAQSAELDRTQIIRLANWLDQARSWYEYESAEVEGSSSTESPDSQNLALRRAESTAHALQSLYEGLPIQSSGRAYTAFQTIESRLCGRPALPLEPSKMRRDPGPRLHVLTKSHGSACSGTPRARP